MKKNLNNIILRSFIKIKIIIFIFIDHKKLLISTMKRRSFLYISSILSLSAFARPFNTFLHASRGNLLKNSILKDPNNILDIHKSLSYNIISKAGSKMSDGFLVPGNADGMAAFSYGINTILVRNHELGRKSGRLMGPFNNPESQLLELGKKHYDKNAFGGTTNIVINNSTKKVTNEFLSLSGTMQNCAGGVTPWNTWLTCEENISKKTNNKIPHGYVFEVDPRKNGIQDPIPFVKMGRFKHEATSFDKYGNAYLTEDRKDGLIYKFVPKNKDSLMEGELFALKTSIKDSRNWNGIKILKNKKLLVEWIKMEDCDPDSDTLRTEGQKKGATIFARGEGITHDGNSLFICCTTGGKLKKGQIWKLTPDEKENSSIELWYEVQREDLMDMPDNLTVSPWGDLIVCEDNSKLNRLWGITPTGNTYIIAENNYSGAEFAGACFSSDGSTLFLNLQQNGLTISIDGDWRSVRS